MVDITNQYTVMVILHEPKRLNTSKMFSYRLHKHKYRHIDIKLKYPRGINLFFKDTDWVNFFSGLIFFSKLPTYSNTVAFPNYYQGSNFAFMHDGLQFKWIINITKVVLFNAYISATTKNIKYENCYNVILHA